MRNSICMFSFLASHIVFLQKMCVVLIGLEVCFFAKRVHVLVKAFQDYQVCWLAETIKVIYPLLFKDYQSLLSCGDYQCHLPFTFQRLSESFASETTKSIGSQRRSRLFAPLHFKDLSMSFVKTITVFFTFSRISKPVVMLT